MYIRSKINESLVNECNSGFFNLFFINEFIYYQVKYNWSLTVLIRKDLSIFKILIFKLFFLRQINLGQKNLIFFFALMIPTAMVICLDLK